MKPEMAQQTLVEHNTTTIRKYFKKLFGLIHLEIA